MRGQRRGSAFSRFKDKARALVERQKSPPAPIQNLRVVTDHIQKYFGLNFFTLHEEKSTVVHLDVHVVLPSAPRPYYTLLTSGMSDRAMRGLRSAAKSALAEVCLCLPKEWPIGQKDMEWATPEFFWPIVVLKNVARYPHVHETWLAAGHTIGSSQQPMALDPENRFVGLILVKPRSFSEEAQQITVADGREIQYLAIIPLLKEELTFKLELGADALDEKLNAAGITELLNPHRRSVISE